MNRLMMLLAFCSLTLLSACDREDSSSSVASGSGGTELGWSTGLDGSLALSELTDEQQISACEASNESWEAWEAENADMQARASC